LYSDVCKVSEGSAASIFNEALNMKAAGYGKTSAFELPTKVHGVITHKIHNLNLYRSENFKSHYVHRYLKKHKLLLSSSNTQELSGILSQLWKTYTTDQGPSLEAKSRLAVMKFPAFYGT
jgi:hypothetical protein